MPKPDLTTQRFGKLTVIRLTDKRTQRRNAIWECVCDCGTVLNVATNNLKNKTHCGCVKQSRPKIDMTNQQIGKLIVLRLYLVGGNKGAIWECQCECGNLAYVSGPHLRAGKTS